MAEYLANDYETTVATDYTSGGTTLVVADSPPSGLLANFRVRVDDEIFLVTAIGGTGNKTWTVTGAQEGTTAANHLTGAKVDQNLTVQGLKNFIDQRATGVTVDQFSLTLANGATSSVQTRTDDPLRRALFGVRREVFSVLSRYSFEEGSGSSTADGVRGVSGAGTLTGSPSWVAGKIGSYALSFSGSNYVAASDTGLPSGNAPRSFAFWVKTSLGSEVYGLSYGTLSVAQGILIGVKSGKLAITQVGASVSGSTTINDNAWHHCIITWSGKIGRAHV